jgi:hypothetical protein
LRACPTGFANSPKRSGFPAPGGTPFLSGHGRAIFAGTFAAGTELDPIEVRAGRDVIERLGALSPPGTGNRMQQCA